MPYSFILQYPYETIEIALCKNGTILDSVTEHKFNAVRATIPNMQALLKQHKITLDDINFIGINIGPGPYNTLRALLTMANGINFAKKIPLISASALTLIHQEHTYPNSVAIFQAFADHIFYSIQTQNSYSQGACSIQELTKVISKYSEEFTALGNGAIRYKDFLIKNTTNIIFPDQIPNFSSLQILATKTYESFVKNSYESTFAKPIYFEDLQKK